MPHIETRTRKRCWSKKRTRSRIMEIFKEIEAIDPLDYSGIPDPYDAKYLTRYNAAQLCQRVERGLEELIVPDDFEPPRYFELVTLAGYELPRLIFEKDLKRRRRRSA